MKRVKILLTDKQTELLQPLFDLAGCNLGMIVGQFYDSTDGNGFFEVGFITEGGAIELQKTIGVTPGKLAPDFHEVYTDVEDEGSAIW